MNNNYPPQQPNNYYQQPYPPQQPYMRPAQQNNTVGLVGFIFSLLAIFFGWVPFVGILLWFVGLICSLIGVFSAPRGLAVAGLIISIIGIILTVVLFAGLVGLAGIAML